MTTASNAKMSRTGPSAGAKVVRMPRKTPAIATVPNARAVAIAYTCRSSMPLRRAASRSSAVARNERPSSVRPIRSCRPTSTATAVPSVMSGRIPIASPSVTVMLALSMAPASIPCESAE